VRLLSPAAPAPCPQLGSVPLAAAGPLLHCALHCLRGTSKGRCTTRCTVWRLKAGQHNMQSDDDCTAPGSVRASTSRVQTYLLPQPPLLLVLSPVPPPPLHPPTVETQVTAPHSGAAPPCGAAAPVTEGKEHIFCCMLQGCCMHCISVCCKMQGLVPEREDTKHTGFLGSCKLPPMFYGAPASWFLIHIR
jgi:hypothetical protein